MNTNIIVLVIVALCVATVCSTAIDNEQYSDFLNRFSKHYNSDEEYAIRYEIFIDNVKRIEEHNSQNPSFLMRINEYADMTHEEFLKTKLSNQINLPSDLAVVSTTSKTNAPPASVDWRTHKDTAVVPPVRNLGKCAAAAAAAVVDAIAADYAITSDDDVYNFNISYVTNCDGQGCGGTSYDVVYTFIEKFGLNWYYTACPTGYGLGICIGGHNCTTAGSEAELQEAVATLGPIPISIDASHTSFQLYHSGIYYEPACSTSTLDHTLLLVGYGSNGNGEDYWIARNSWGSSWGQGGDVLLARNKNNNCGVASYACYATRVRSCVCDL